MYSLVSSIYRLHAFISLPKEHIFASFAQGVVLGDLEMTKTGPLSLVIRQGERAVELREASAIETPGFVSL